MMTTPPAVPLPRRLGVFAALSAVLGLLFLAAAPPASAHTALIKSTPAKGATVAALTEVSLTFNEPVRSARVLVRDTGGANHQSGAPGVDGATVVQRVAAGLPSGRYTIAYRIVSADGHPVQEEFSFTLAGGTDPAGAGPAGSTPGGAGPAQPGAVLPRAADPARPADAASTARPEPDLGGGTTWTLIVVGLMIGVAIGTAFTLLRRRPPGGSDRSGRAGDDDQGSADEPRGSSGGE